MIKKQAGKRRKLAHEILGLIGLSALLALLLFLILSGIAGIVAENYCFYRDIPMDEFAWMQVDQWIFTVSTVISVLFFSILFLGMLADKIAYIRAITAGIDALREQQSHQIPQEGNNELTELAKAINTFSDAQRQLREKERQLAEEKEQFLRTLSHDIRTPLTSILAYSEYLEHSAVSDREQLAYLSLIRKKAVQIKELTDILLDGSKRNVEWFADARLLMEQLAAEFEEELEADFSVTADLSGCAAFSGSFDVQELRRILDNLSSNVRKYADAARKVTLSIRVQAGQVQIVQRNAIRTDAPKSESYQLGLHSIRRIAQFYDGRVEVQQDSDNFTITVTLLCAGDRKATKPEGNGERNAYDPENDGTG